LINRNLGKIRRSEAATKQAIHRAVKPADL
jgi:hypothetical protein